VKNPGKPNQSVAFLTLLDPSTGGNVSGLDDALFPTTNNGTFYITDTNNNRVLKFRAEDLPIGSLYANVGSLNEFARVDLNTGYLTALLSNLNAPHGMVFIPESEDQNDHGENQQ
jgi:hypothetical protein